MEVATDGRCLAPHKAKAVARTRSSCLPARWLNVAFAASVSVTSKVASSSRSVRASGRASATADALAKVRWREASPDPDYAEALRAALEACAVVAASDTLRDNNVPEAGMLADTRRVWGPFDHAPAGLPRMAKRPA